MTPDVLAQIDPPANDNSGLLVHPATAARDVLRERCRLAAMPQPDFDLRGLHEREIMVRSAAVIILRIEEFDRSQNLGSTAMRGDAS